MIECGILREDARLELIEGEIVPMPPHGPDHWHSVASLTGKLVRTFGETHMVCPQLSLDLGDSQPEPDFSLIPLGLIVPKKLPTTADLVIEVAKTSLAFDRHEKASVYAKAGIPELWIINLIASQVEVLRRPHPSSEGAYGYAYGSVDFLRGEETVAPLFRPEAVFKASELLLDA